MKLIGLETADGKFKIIDESIQVGDELIALSSILEAKLRNAKGEEFILPCRLVRIEGGRTFICPCELIDES